MLCIIIGLTKLHIQVISDLILPNKHKNSSSSFKQHTENINLKYLNYFELINQIKEGNYKHTQGIECDMI